MLCYARFWFEYFTPFAYFTALMRFPYQICRYEPFSNQNMVCSLASRKALQFMVTAYSDTDSERKWLRVSM